MISHKVFPWLLVITALWAAACKSETSTEKDTTTDSDSGEPADICTSFHNYAEGCEVTGQPLMLLDLICSTMDSIFIDSFLRDTMECFTPDSCEEFIDLLSSAPTDIGTDPDAGVSDAGVPDDAFSACAESAILTAEPEPANINFQEHFCNWVMQCDGDVSELQCALYFTDPNEMLMFTILDVPYITDADACVYPMPSCTEDVAGCLENVTEDISSALGVLSIL